MYLCESNRMFLYKHALVSMHVVFHLCLLLEERFSRGTKLSKLLLADNAAAVTNTDPFPICNTGYETVQNGERSGS